MNWITDLFNWLSKIFQWWIIVLPWEMGIRVRFGKRKRILGPGIYLKIPILDEVFIQTIRLRFIGLPIQTVTTKDGVTLTISSSLGYSITNIEKLYESIFHPESALTAIASAAMADYVASNILDNCDIFNIQENAVKQLSVNDYGIGGLTFKINGYACVKTYRLIQDQTWFPPDRHEEKYK